MNPQFKGLSTDVESGLIWPPRGVGILRFRRRAHTVDPWHLPSVTLSWSTSSAGSTGC